MKLNKKNLFLIFMLLLLFTKIDFRFKEIDPGLIHDDAAYYYHTQTIGVDQDFDYSNQLAGTDKRNLNVENGNPVPVHPIGVGLLAGPFMFFSNLLSEQFLLDSIISFNYFIYSLVSIFYLFLSINLLKRILISKVPGFNQRELYLFIFGSGITYYAFERFSMSHIYEFFGICSIFYLSFTYEKKTKKNYKLILEFLIPISMFLLLTIRWSNYHIFLIPLFYSFLFQNKVKKIYLKPAFMIGFILSIFGFLMHTKYLYGIYTFNPSDIFLLVENRLSENYENLKNPSLFFQNIRLTLMTFLITSFSQEFGIFYFSSIVFIGFIFLVFLLLQKQYLLFFITSVIYIIPFSGIVVFQNTSYSYGFRYLFSLIPINLLIYFRNFHNVKFIKYYLNIFSFFGLLGLLMFEVSNYTVLSTDYVTNSFGQMTKFANPEYLSGVIISLSKLDSYLNIIFTSFFGLIIIKLLSYLTEPVSFISNFRVVNDDIANMIFNAKSISWFYIFILLSLLGGITYNLNRKIKVH